jgi:hypothetical protein
MTSTPFAGGSSLPSTHPSTTNNNNNNTTTPGDLVMRRSRTISDFDASLIPRNAIYTRQHHAFSVHYSVATAKWIVTLAGQGPALMPGATSSIHHSEHNSNDKRGRCVSFSFASEREARKFAKAYTPPKMMTDASKCFICSTTFSTRCCPPFHCRNCGVCICDQCSTRWGVRMIPRTYLVTTGNSTKSSALTTRVCKSCDWLSNAFCMALLQGKYENAIIFHESGNINLRCCFADIHKEAMFPVHCAVRYFQSGIRASCAMNAVKSFSSS